MESMTATTRDGVVARLAENGKQPDYLERGELNREQIEMLIAATARELLHVEADEALRMLDSGELEGTLAGESLRSLRWLLTA
jgi:hypothetical protein